MTLEKNSIKLILLHLGIGVLISFFPILSKAYSVLIVLSGFYFVVKNKNRNHEVLYVVAYLVGSEVFLRSNQRISYEFAKYFMLLFLVLGMFYKGISKKAYPYLVFLLLLLPGILISLFTLEPDIRRKIVFDISGPVCLAFCSLYTYNQKISFRKINNILFTIGLPILSTCTFLFINSPIGKLTATTTASSFFLSGGFGPNQVSTILGLGMFVFFARLVLISSTKPMMILTMALAAYIYYRGLLTFSRGGMITGIAIILLLLLSLYFNSKNYQNIRLTIGLVISLLLIVSAATSYQTNWALTERYASVFATAKNATGEAKGRKRIALNEIKFFKENPVLGIGVGKGKEIRKKQSGKNTSSHCEMTRLLAEHGVLGLISILILLYMPMQLWIRNRQNIYFLSFIAFWLLTVNHSGMRIAAPAFIYGLALLNVRSNRKTTTSLA